MRMSEVRKDVLGKDIYSWRQIFAVRRSPRVVKIVNYSCPVTYSPNFHCG